MGPQTGSYLRSYDANFYDVTRDGQRFLVDRVADATSQPALTVVVNWTAALKK